MTKKRRKLDDKFKARVALEAVRSDKTLSQLGSEFKVNPNQISKWKSQLINNASMVFSEILVVIIALKMRLKHPFTKR